MKNARVRGIVWLVAVGASIWLAARTAEPTPIFVACAMYMVGRGDEKHGDGW